MLLNTEENTVVIFRIKLYQYSLIQRCSIGRKTSSNRIGFSPSLPIQTVIVPAWLAGLCPAPAARWLAHTLVNNTISNPGSYLCGYVTRQSTNMASYLSFRTTVCCNKAKKIVIKIGLSTRVPTLLFYTSKCHAVTFYNHCFRCTFKAILRRVCNPGVKGKCGMCIGRRLRKREGCVLPQPSLLYFSWGKMATGYVWVQLL